VLRFGHAGVVRELCGKGADPTAVNKEGAPTPEKKILTTFQYDIIFI
jgi:hypothetical protein